MKKAYYKNKKYFLSGLFIAIAVFAAVSPKIVNADVFYSLKNASVALLSSPILLSLGTISVLCVAVCGALNSLIISALINISKYNNFIHEPSIVGAWVVVRDLCNMFFILILLVVAFATILRIESYQWKKILPKLLIMAVLINFSRTICGLIIDGSQIIMLTFVNAWANAGDFVDIMGMVKYFHGNMFDGFTEKGWSVLKVVTGMIIGIMFLIISMIVLLVAMAVFLMRVVMLWIYIVLSPIAFLAAAFPAGQKYATQWWSEFMRYIINGPVLAFFIWMALISKNQITKIGDINTANATANQCFGITEATCLNSFLPWIISIGMLLGGLMITQQIGGIGAGMAGKGMGWIKGMASMPVGVGKAVGKYGVFKAGRHLDNLQMGIQKRVAGLMGMKEGIYKPKSLNYRVIAAGWKAMASEDMEKYESQHSGLTNVWHDNFNKYVRLGQYGAFRKSRKRQAVDEEAAGKLDYENKMLFERKQNFGLSIPEKNEKRETLKASKEAIISDYKSKGFSKEEAEKEFNKDRASLVGEKTYQKMTGENIAGIDTHVIKNQAKAAELRNKNVFGFKGATQYEAQYSKAGAKEILEKKTKEMEQRTEGKDFAVISELIKAYQEKDQHNIAAAFRILAKSNDLNEALKDSRLNNLMTQDGGVLDKLAGSMEGDEKRNLLDNMGNVKNSMRSNPVSPANVQAMIQGMFAASGMEKGMAARYTSDIGTISFGAGNSVIFGAAKGNPNTGSFAFNELKVDRDGALVSSDDRINAIIGKFANMGSQEKMRTIHPDVIIKEAPDGSGAGIHAEGEAFLKTINSHDLTQITRLRLDVIRKIGGSKLVLSDAKRIVKELDEKGDKASVNQARIIKNFIGYCKKSYEGAIDESNNKSLSGAESSFNEIA